MERSDIKNTSFQDLYDYINSVTNYQCHIPWKTASGYLAELEIPTNIGESIISEIEFCELTKESFIESLMNYNHDFRYICDQEIKNRASSSNMTIWELSNEAARLVDEFDELTEIMKILNHKMETI